MPNQELTEDLSVDLAKLPAQWEALGIDPDDFVRCAECRLIIRGFEIEGDQEKDICHCS